MEYSDLSVGKGGSLLDRVKQFLLCKSQQQIIAEHHASLLLGELQVKNEPVVEDKKVVVEDLPPLKVIQTVGWDEFVAADLCVWNRL